MEELVMRCAGAAQALHAARFACDGTGIRGKSSMRLVRVTASGDIADARPVRATCHTEVLPHTYSKEATSSSEASELQVCRAGRLHMCMCVCVFQVLRRGGCQSRQRRTSAAPSRAHATARPHVTAVVPSVLYMAQGRGRREGARKVATV